MTEFKVSPWVDTFHSAERNLISARQMNARGNYEWAYLRAKLAAADAMRALLQHRNIKLMGKELESIFRQLQAEYPQAAYLREYVRFLQHKFDEATASMAEVGIKQAERILKWVAQRLKI